MTPSSPSWLTTHARLLCPAPPPAGRDEPHTGRAHVCHIHAADCLRRQPHPARQRQPLRLPLRLQARLKGRQRLQLRWGCALGTLATTACPAKRVIGSMHLGWLPALQLAWPPALQAPGPGATGRRTGATCSSQPPTRRRRRRRRRPGTSSPSERGLVHGGQQGCAAQQSVHACRACRQPGLALLHDSTVLHAGNFLVCRRSHTATSSIGSGGSRPASGDMYCGGSGGGGSGSGSSGGSSLYRGTSEPGAPAQVNRDILRVGGWVGGWVVPSAVASASPSAERLAPATVPGSWGA
jgi:hypothetical protein